MECCVIECPKSADWTIRSGDDVYGEVYACTEHVGYLLEVGVTSHVWEVEEG